MPARRSPWLDERAALLAKTLSERHGLQMPDDVMAAARDDISDHLDQLAALMRIGRQAAKMYVTDDVIAKMAQRIAIAYRHAAGNSRGLARPHLRVVD
ncbi:hypothetical protein [Mycobacterium aquaticum]|uniref:Uncharacterized protein n=1 Tax=Mycobacterium aquaticum TaxID=1927124 RepID=A0A1X0A089_9MYCO|nr:hypothetical protein [Mycobacterium aquaticum]ORA23384.1 hypothetical protein BST13_35105 [Mycobacterium aquaticum]